MEVISKYIDGFSLQKKKHGAHAAIMRLRLSDGLKNE